MSALSNCVTCGISDQAWLKCSAVFRRTPVMGLRSTSPHLREVGQRRAAAGSRGRGWRQRAAAEAAQDLPGERLDVLLGNASVRAGARDLTDVDANLARDASHRWRGRRRRGRWHGRTRGGRGRRRRGRLPPAEVHDRRALPRILFRVSARLAWSPPLLARLAVLLRSLPASASAWTPRRFSLFGLLAPALGGRCRLSIRRRTPALAAAPSTVRITWPVLTLSPTLTSHVLDHAFDAGWHFERRLVGFELEHRLVLA